VRAIGAVTLVASTSSTRTSVRLRRLRPADAGVVDQNVEAYPNARRIRLTNIRRSSGPVTSAWITICAAPAPSSAGGFGERVGAATAKRDGHAAPGGFDGQRRPIPEPAR